MLMSCAAAASAQPAADPGSPASYAPIDPARLSSLTRALASDETQGRAPGTEGERRTIAWLIEQFRGLGLQPGGENGGWTQRVPLIRTQLAPRPTVTIAQGGESRTLEAPRDIYLSTVREVDRVRIANAPLVFVGYGVTAPERNWMWPPTSTFSSAVRCGNTAEIWNERTRPSRATSAGFIAVMSCPL